MDIAMATAILAFEYGVSVDSVTVVCVVETDSLTRLEGYSSELTLWQNNVLLCYV